MALSGGPDSSALLLALTEAADAGLPVPRPAAAAHFHHGLRGADADEDAEFSTSLSQSLDIPCRVVRGTVPKNTGRSPNDAARRARYTFLEETARDMGATHIATGHTADDQAETVLGRVLRGTSVDGLAGIPPRRNLAPALLLVRPILGLRRADVEAYCAFRGIVPRRDPSNEKDRYTRSRLRKRLPLLVGDFNIHLIPALNRLAAHAAADSDYLTAQADTLWHETTQGSTPACVWFNAARLSHEHAALRRRVLLRGILEIAEAAGAEEDAATAAWVDVLDALLHDAAGKPVTLPGSIRAERTSGSLLLCAPENAAPVVPLPSATPIPIPVPGSVEIPWTDRQLSVRPLVPGEEAALRQHRASVIDIALPENAMLVVRNAAKGERMAPLGMNGKRRLVRDLLADARIPVDQRDTAPVVARADTGEILWLIGIAQAESTRVTSDSLSTDIVLRLSADSSGQ